MKAFAIVACSLITLMGCGRSDPDFYGATNGVMVWAFSLTKSGDGAEGRYDATYWGRAKGTPVRVTETYDVAISKREHDLVLSQGHTICVRWPIAGYNAKRLILLVPTMKGRSRVLFGRTSIKTIDEFIEGAKDYASDSPTSSPGYVPVLVPRCS